MRFTSKLYFIAMICFLTLVLCHGCSKEDGTEKTLPKPKGPADFPPVQMTYDRLPENISWQTNDNDPVFASPGAQKGGTLREALVSFPMTFRVVGPDSNGGFASELRANQFSLIGIHPNTGRIIPELATHWAFGDDKKTMYFRLDPDARWSDGQPVTARDYLFTLEFMRSPNIVAPWYNDYYTREIEKVVAFDDYTIAVVSTKAVPDLHLKLGIRPVPEHFYRGLGKDFVQKYNWAVEPNTGAYQIREFKKGRFIRFRRKADWWARDKRYFKNRFNVDLVQFRVIRDYNLQWEYFKKGRIDAFAMNLPKYWHQKSRARVFQQGWVDRIWFFNDLPRPSYGMWLNQDKAIFRDVRLRYAFAHAMNVDKVLLQVLRGDYFRLAQPFFGYGDYTDYTIQPRAFDIERVEGLMTDAGWARGTDGIWARDKRRFSVNVTYTLDDHMPRIAVLKEEALKAGIELKLEKLDQTAAFKKFLEKKHDVAWMGWSTSLRPSYWQGWHSDNAHKVQTNNITNTDDPDLDQLIDSYRESLKTEERIRLSRQIQNKIHKIGAFVPTYMVPYTRAAYWRWLRLPEWHGTKMSDSLFDPFSSLSGGLFWIDRVKRQETLDAMKTGRSFDPVVTVDTQYKN